MAYRSEEDREHRVQYAREVREYRKSLGMCSRCGNDKIAVNSKALCSECLEKGRENAEKRRAAMTLEEKQLKQERYNARRREMQAKRRSEGLCAICGKPAYNGHSKCIDHFLYFKRKGEEAGVRKKKGYAEQGLCIICGKECVQGKKFCPEHYQQKLENLKKAEKAKDLKKHPWKQNNDVAFRKNRIEGEKE